MEAEVGEIKGCDSLVFDSTRDTGPVTDGSVGEPFLAQRATCVDSNGFFEREKSISIGGEIG